MTLLRTGAAAGAAILAIAAAAPADAEMFNRIATFHVVDNLPADADPATGTVAEIISATDDGMTLVYTDSPGERLGFIDLADPRAPRAAGTVALGGEPTSRGRRRQERPRRGGDLAVLRQPLGPRRGGRHRRQDGRCHLRSRRPARLGRPQRRRQVLSPW